MSDLTNLIGPVARILLGEPNKALSTKRELRFGSHGSMSVDLRRGVWFDHSSGVGGGVLDLIERERGLHGRERFDWITRHGFQIEQQAHAAPGAASSNKKPDDDKDKVRRAGAIWREASDPAGTLVELYLTKRSVALPPDCTAVRFHGCCPFGTAFAPAMVCLVTDIITNVPKAIHRTVLDQNGNAVEIEGRKKWALGPVGGGAVKLTPDEHVTKALGLAEGVETALSLQRLPEWLGSPVWSVLSAGGISGFPLLAGIETLAVAVDSDLSETGDEAACKVIARWHADGRETFAFRSATPATDLNDVVST